MRSTANTTSLGHTGRFDGPAKTYTRLEETRLD